MNVRLNTKVLNFKYLKKQNIKDIEKINLIAVK